MRKDMKHVIIDRPRTGGDGGDSTLPKGWSRREQKMGFEDLPLFESSARKRRYGYECKQLNDNLSPLKRWLQSKIGQKWDEVYKEICENLRNDSVSQGHVRTHIDQMVVTETQIIDNEVCDSRGDSLEHPGRYWECFYVDQKGFLREIQYKRRWRYKKPKHKWFPGKDDDHQYHCIKGVWYEVEVRPYPQPANERACHPTYRDVVLNKTNTAYTHEHLLNRSECNKLYGREVYAHKKRQLPTKECKKLYKNFPDAVRIREESIKAMEDKK